jgi:hypothetical protein
MKNEPFQPPQPTPTSKKEEENAKTTATTDEEMGVKKKRDRNEQQLESPGASCSVITHRQRRNESEENPNEEDGISSSDDEEESPGAHAVGSSSIDQENPADNVENQVLTSEEMIMISAQVVDPASERKAMEEEIRKEVLAEAVIAQPITSTRKVVPLVGAIIILAAGLGFGLGRATSDDPTFLPILGKKPSNSGKTCNTSIYLPTFSNQSYSVMGTTDGLEHMILQDSCILDDEEESSMNVTTTGIWWTVFAESNSSFTASTCSNETNFDTQLSIYSGPCGELLECVAGNNDSEEEECCDLQNNNNNNNNNTLCSVVRWLAIENTTYQILVHGNETGEFELTVSSSESIWYM